jgi:hypothetical protein
MQVAVVTFDGFNELDVAHPHHHGPALNSRHPVVALRERVPFPGSLIARLPRAEARLRPRQAAGTRS